MTKPGWYRRTKRVSKRNPAWQRQRALRWKALRVLSAICAACCLSGHWVAPLAAATEASLRCDSAALEAAQALGVPVPMMRAITRVETGRRQNGQLRPWPWTVNLGGDGHWFNSAAEARAFASAHVARGRQNIDIGCFQVNYRWHGRAFASTDQMFDPEANALYAARFLKRLYAETGGWDAAVAAYHSRTPEYARRYMARYRSVLAAVEGAPLPPLQDTQNRYPLLQPGGPSARSLGSLTPLGSAGGAFLDLAGG
ncbi:transglycosylase SLT domain-containing protein [Alloyangia pacifica]|uniref:transglycosylase SLT domain-containing protein n=1 Tax=Alloyangia pacifica TaxID=311180 RepID=UPI001CD24E9E|nr:transglycosylase SLT domain-containing protein [Alloyangia pacifica]MCA0995409.1 transglycosylase SLT domain-containing protein [Alloyangia pacifica]